MLFFSSDVEDMAQEGTSGGGNADDLAVNAHLSEAEMGDILSGFSPEGEGEAPLMGMGGGTRGTMAGESGNLDVILDIQLVATARLGRVEMAIEEILSLGPGSVIEVGHLVTSLSSFS